MMAGKVWKNVFRENGVDENVNRSKEKSITDAVKHLDADDHPLHIRQKCKDEESGGMTKDTDDHGPFPT